MKSLRSRLSFPNAQLLFISSQPEQYERSAAKHFRFRRDLGLYTVVHFVNDPRKEIAPFLVDKFGQTVVCVDAVDSDVGGGVSFQYGMLQSGVVCVHGLFNGTEKLLDLYAYDSKSSGDIIGARRPARLYELSRKS